MRRCLAGDLISAAACVAAADPAMWGILARRLLTEADAAHRYAKRFGRAHPDWGNGSLMARANLLGTPKPIVVNSAGFMAAMSLVSSLIADQKAVQKSPYCG